MFIDYDILYILGPALVLFVGMTIVMRLWYGKAEDPLKNALRLFRFNMIMVGAFCVLLWFLLPMTPVLSTFGYPKSDGDVQATRLLLNYLQDYNRALVRTTSVLYWFIFVFVWWFIASLFDFTRVVSALGSRNIETNDGLTAQPDPSNA